MPAHPTLNQMKLVAAVALMAGAGHASAQLEQLQWLEAPQDPKALAWARDQTALTTKTFSQKAVYQPVRKQLKSALQAGAPLADVILLGTRAIRLQKDAAHPHGQLQVAPRLQNGAPGAWKSVLDVAALGAKEGKEYELRLTNLTAFGKSCLAPAYRYCMLALAPAGGDEIALREFDFGTGKFVPGGLSVPSSRTEFAWLDKDRMLITHTLGDAPRTSAGWGAAVRLWHRGEDVQKAAIVYQAKPTDALVTVDRVGEGASALGVINRVIDYSTFALMTVDAAGKLTNLALPQKLKSFGALATTGRHVIVQLAQDTKIGANSWPAETVLSYDTDPQAAPSARVQAVYRQQAGEYVDIGMGSPLAGLKSSLVFTVTRGLQKSVKVATDTSAGWRTREVFAAPSGVNVTFDSSDEASQDVVLRTQGYLVPAGQRLLRAGELGAAIGKEAPVFDASNMLAESCQATSRDGTTIDYYLIRPRYIKPGQTTPTLMTGYGAFGISTPPAYFGYDIGGKGAKLWFERGGAIAIPAIRGGGERGEAWHRAAMGALRQNSYNDFIAVAEDLVRRGFARPKQMGVFGLSNGGLLAATIGLQRPDLFGAVVSDVPLIDMLRFPLMGMGGAWTGEYGDPRDPAMEKVLRSYSPLHIAKAGVRYPPFLVTTATSDNRVGPGHARKMVARLHELGATAYLYEDAEGGHGVSDALSRPELMALRMTFLIDTLMPPAK